MRGGYLCRGSAEGITVEASLFDPNPSPDPDPDVVSTPPSWKRTLRGLGR